MRKTVEPTLTVDDLRRMTTVTVNEAAAVIGSGRNLLRARIDAGEVPVLRYGRRIRVPAWWALRQLGLDP